MPATQAAIGDAAGEEKNGQYPPPVHVLLENQPNLGALCVAEVNDAKGRAPRTG